MTPRTRQVLDLAARGHTNPEIADLLSVTAKTVDNYLQTAARALGCATVRQTLYRYALTHAAPQPPGRPGPHGPQ